LEQELVTKLLEVVEQMVELVELVQVNMQVLQEEQETLQVQVRVKELMVELILDHPDHILLAVVVEAVELLEVLGLVFLEMLVADQEEQVLFLL
jgi:hypothetical protein